MKEGKKAEFLPGSVGLKDFKVIQLIGSGARGEVFKVQSLQNGQEYALKKIKMTKQN